MVKPFLSLSDICKAYPGVQALDHVDLEAGAGEIIGLVGENGAGKSTLMKILGGVVQPSAGRIVIDGHDYSGLSVAQSMAEGIAFVHQELNLFDNLDVAANVYIGREPLMGGALRLVDRKTMARMVQPYLDMLGAEFTPTTMVSTLSIASRQILEIAKALSQDARLLILDEPTSSLTMAETERLLNVIRTLKARGVCVIFVTHRLNELTACADRVVALRDGKPAGNLSKSEITPAAMVQLMIGRDLKSLYTQPKAGALSAVVLEIAGLTTTAWPAEQVDLSLRAGEILGLAGLIGAGRTELARAIFGIDRFLKGEIRINGQPLRPGDPRQAIAAGIFLVPEDRKQLGILLDLTIAENVVLADLPNHAKAFLVQRAEIQATAQRMKGELDIRAPDVDVLAGNLSGGNQQKVVLAKWLSLSPSVMICDEPTRGIDVGAKQEIYLMLRRLADKGIAVLMISSDMEEVIGVSDRVAVMHEGHINGILKRDELSEHAVMQLAVSRDQGGVAA
ncbi:MAG: sugar ABC transporter ATP-binding protein [Cypionkella sp.]